MKPKVSPFVHLHVHSEYSILDGLGRQKDYLARVAELGQPAIAFTEHGSLRGIFKLTENLKELKAEVKPKPLFGCELYVCRNRHSRGLPEEEEAKIRSANKGRKAIGDALYKRETELGLRDRWHLTVLAKNNVGLRNLFRLSSVGWLEGFWKRPRIDLETLDCYGDGLIILSGCMMGVVPNLIVKGDFGAAVERMDWFRERFGEDLFLEVQPNSLPEQRTVNRAMVKFARRYGLPLVATADTHYVKEDHTRTHELLLCVRSHDFLSNPNRFKFSVQDFWLKTRKEMLEGFARWHPELTEADIRSALNSTLDITERCEASLTEDKFAALIPSPGLPKKFGDDEFGFLKHLCWLGWEHRDLPGRVKRVAKVKGIRSSEMAEAYLARLKMELGEIRRKDVVRYFLVVWDLYRWARSEGIEAGPGRGSAGGCLISFLLGITDVDPVEHNLLFERFLNPDRIDLPDIDCDFEDARREEVVGYLRRKYGEDRVANIATTTTMRGKGCVRDIGRVLEIPYGEVDTCVAGIVDNPTDEGGDIVQRAFESSTACKEFNERHPEVLDHAKILEGHARGLGIHAAGIVVCPVPLVEVVPLETRVKAGETITVTGLEMEGCQALGLLKIDLLGLRNLTVIKHCLAEVKNRHGIDLDLNTIELNDPKVLDGFTRRNFVGIFQYDTQSAYNISEGVKFTTFDDVVAINALNRPGTARSGLAAEWLERKADPSKIVPLHPVVDRVCSDTLGVIVYQEHVIRLFVEFAGFTPGKADALRKKISKSFGIKAIAEERQAFIKGAKKKGNDPKLAAFLFNRIAAFGQYGFNKSHATAYSLIAYREMWLKTYYPGEFMVALLRCEKDTEAIKRCVKECRRLGVKVRPPHVNRSLLDFHLDHTTIVGSLNDVKGVGAIAAESILAGRKDRDFISFVEFLKRVDRRKVNKRVVVSLVKAGAFGDLVPNRKWFLDNMEELWKLIGRAEWEKKVSHALRESTSFPDFTTIEKTLVAAEVCPYASDRHPLEPYRDFLYETLSVPWLPLNDEDFWDRKYGFIYGMIVAVKYKRVGDYHTGEEPDEEEKKCKRWGAMYAQVHLEDLTGATVRVKVDLDTFDTFKPILDRGEGVPVAAHVGIDGKWKSVRVHTMTAIDSLRRAFLDKKPIDPFGRVLLGGKWHPVAPHSKMNVTKVAAAESKRVTLKAMVTTVNTKVDKRGEDYAFIGLLGFKGYVELLCFASSWSKFKKRLHPGDVVTVRVTKGDRDTLFLDNRGGMTVLAKCPSL